MGRSDGRNTRGMKPNGRGHGKEPFVRALWAIYDHPDYLALGKTARLFLWEMLRLYNGYNNGNIAATERTMKPYGWDKKTILRSRRELEARDWIWVTRYPRAKREPILYRFSWLDVDDWDGRPDLDPGSRKRPRRSLRP